jgi:hypothetical protein
MFDSAKTGRMPVPQKLFQLTGRMPVPDKKIKI